MTAAGKEDRIRMRVDSDLKETFQLVCEAEGAKMSEVLREFMLRVVAESDVEVEVSSDVQGLTVDDDMAESALLRAADAGEKMRGYTVDRPDGDE